MIPASIEREILIDAPIEVVWRVVTEPTQIVQWFAYRADIEARPGAAGQLTFQDGGDVQVQVEAVDAPRLFAWRWVHAPGSVAHERNSTLVEFMLEPAGSQTRLRVVESGFDTIDWSDEDRASAVEDHEKGWDFMLGRLRDYAPRAR